MRPTLFVLAIAVAVVLLPTVAEARDKPARPAPGGIFDRLDADGNGILTRAEFATAAKQRMQSRRGGPSRGARNERGRFRVPSAGPVGRRPMARAAKQHRRGPQARQQFRRARHQMAAAQRGRGQAGGRRQGRPQGRKPDIRALFQRLDRDGNGQLGLREFAFAMRMLHDRKPAAGRQAHGFAKGREQRGRTARAGARKHRGQAGRRAAVTRQHPRAAARKHRGQADRRAAMTRHHPRATARKPARATQRRPQRGASVHAAILARIKQADADQDGKISRKEAPGPLAERFNRLDADGDGYLTQPEIRRGIAALSKMRRPGARAPGKDAPERRKKRKAAGPID